jgi:hypothetical protein
MRIKVDPVELSVETVGSWPDQLCAALSGRYVLCYELSRDGCRRFIAHLLTLDHPDQVASLTLVSARPVAPGPVDPDPPITRRRRRSSCSGVRSRTGPIAPAGRLR